MYLCGFTLFLSLILNRTYTMILDILRLEERVKSYDGKSSGSSSIGDAALRQQLEQKDLDLETMKKQSEGLHREYNNLSDRYSAMAGSDGVPRKEL